MPFLQTLGGGSAKGFRVKTVGQGIVAVGGIETSSGGYKIHTFNYTGSNQTFSVSTGGNVEMLVVAGGGGGGGDNSGGGGAGGLLYYGAEAPNAGSFITVAPGTYNINVGAGGSGSPAVNTPASNGTDTTVSGPGVSITANGGGLGGTGNTAAEHNGGSGGSGGGGAAEGSVGTGGNGTGGQGNNGGGGSNGAGGGGGGAGGVGQAGNVRGSQLGGDGGAGLQYSISGSAQYYAAGGNGGNENSQFNQRARVSGVGGQTNSSGSTGTVDAVDGTGSGGGGVTHSTSANSAKGSYGSYGGHGIVIIRYLPGSGNTSFNLADWQSESAGVYTIINSNGISMNIELISQDGRKWFKIPYGTEPVNGTFTGASLVTNNMFTNYAFGTYSNGGLQYDGSYRFNNDNETNGPNVNSKQVIFDLGLNYRYVRVYCSEIQSHTGSGSGVPNPDWGAETCTIGSDSGDLSGGFGDHPFWITGWDNSGGTPRYRGVSGNTGSGSSWVSGSTGGWSTGESGNVTRSFTSGTIDTGTNYSHDKVGLGIAGGASEYYRHNRGYFLIS